VLGDPGWSWGLVSPCRLRLPAYPAGGLPGGQGISGSSWGVVRIKNIRIPPQASPERSGGEACGGLARQTGLPLLQLPSLAGKVDTEHPEVRDKARE
jgi:hypothetical protein